MTQTAGAREDPDDPSPSDTTPLAELEDNLIALASDLAAAECRWLMMVAEFDRREGWATHGVVSCAHWLSWRCGFGLGTAREKVRVARALTGLPKVAEAFERGELSYSRAKQITRAATPDNEESLVELARHTTGAQLERIVRATVGVQKLEDGSDREARQHVHWHWAEDGSLVLRARLGPVEGAAVINAIEAAQWADTPARVVSPAGSESQPATETERVPEAQGEVELVPPAQEELVLRRVDALVAVAEAFVASRAPVYGADVYQVVVHVRDDAAPYVEEGPALPAETALRLACDASIYCVHQDRKGSTLDVGRQARTVGRALRRALWLRDAGCRFPGCARRRRLDAHHVVHWAKGGPTSLANLLLLCRRHHVLTHEGGFGLRLDEQGAPVFARPDGSLIPEVPAAPTSTGAPREWHQVDVDSSAVDTRWQGYRLDLPYVVTGLTELDGRHALRRHNRKGPEEPTGLPPTGSD